LESQNAERRNTIDPEQLPEIDNYQNLQWSPNEQFLLHRVEDGDDVKYYVVPVVLKKNAVNTTDAPLPTKSELFDDPVLTMKKNDIYSVQWFPDSKHLLVTKKIDNAATLVELIEIDGSNRTQVFSGSINELEVFPNLNGSKIIIMTRFNPGSEKFNLYSINLRV